MGFQLKNNNGGNETLAQKQEELRKRALAFEQRDAAKRQREQRMKEEEEIRSNPQLAAERERRLAVMREDEERRAKFKAEEEAKIEAERRVQEKRMDQTEALIAAIRAQVEKEKAAKEAANKKDEMYKSRSQEKSAKPQFRTISPEEVERLQERKRMKEAGIPIPPENSVPKNGEKENGSFGGVSGGLGGLGNGPTLSNPNAGQDSLLNGGLTGSGLGIEITADKKQSGADESTVALDVDVINAALEGSKGKASSGNTTVVENDANNWGMDETRKKGTEGLNWVESDVELGRVKEEHSAKDNLVDENGDIISVIPVRKKPTEANDVYSVYNIDFDDDDDDLEVYNSSANDKDEWRRKAEEEARRKAEEEARRKAEEEARRKAEEEARRKAEEEARRKAEEEARRKAEEEARRKAEEEARRKAEEEARRKAEEEARRKAEEEARRKAEEEARRKAEEEARRKVEEEARRKAEEEARRKAEEEARRKAEEEARRKAEEEARRKAEEEARRKAEEEARRKAEREALIKAEEEARRKAEEEAIKYKKLAEEAARQAEEAMKALEAARKAVEEEEKAEKARVENALEEKVDDTVDVKAEKQESAGFTLPFGAEQYLGKYLSVNAISDQIVQTMRYIIENPSEPRNIVILGQYGFGTTTIAEDFARSFYAMGICKNKTIAKIKAGALNRANIGDAISKLQGGCLVIENAGVISNDKLNELYQIVNNPDNDVIIILTGQIETLSRIFKDNVVISSQFKHLIQVHRITDLDVFAIAKNHAEKLGYPCEQDAENMLRRRMREVESGNLDRVLKIVDNAVSKAHNREMTTGEQEHHLISGDFE